jgi:hypothetical protein
MHPSKALEFLQHHGALLYQRDNTEHMLQLDYAEFSGNKVSLVGINIFIGTQNRRIYESSGLTLICHIYSSVVPHHR